MLRIRVPATSANLGPGFDCVGVALSLYNTFSFLTEPEECKVLSPGFTDLPAGSLCHQSFNLTARHLGRKAASPRVRLAADVPLARGLGSSATLIVAGVVAANALLSGGLTSETCLSLAARVEGHPDNVAPALLGGLVLTMTDSSRINYRKIIPPAPLQVVVAVPDFELSTQVTRKVLPAKVPLFDAAANISRYGFLISALLSGDYNGLAAAMEDSLHQPYRLPLIPGLFEVIAAARDAGALGSCLSGAGPSVLAFCTNNAADISTRMAVTWQRLGIKSETYLLFPDQQGAVAI